MGFHFQKVLLLVDPQGMRMQWEHPTFTLYLKHYSASVSYHFSIKNFKLITHIIIECKKVHVLQEIFAGVLFLCFLWLTSSGSELQNPVEIFFIHTVLKLTV